MSIFEWICAGMALTFVLLMAVAFAFGQMTADDINADP